MILNRQFRNTKVSANRAALVTRRSVERPPCEAAQHHGPCRRLRCGRSRLEFCDGHQTHSGAKVLAGTVSATANVIPGVPLTRGGRHRRAGLTRVRPSALSCSPHHAYSRCPLPRAGQPMPFGDAELHRAACSCRGRS
jgi:hypothetical protein